MSETVIPTMSLRYAMKKVPVSGHDYLYEMKPVLQQCFLKVTGGEVWRDVPTVMGDAAYEDEGD